MKKNIKNTLIGFGIFAVALTLFKLVKKIRARAKENDGEEQTRKPLFESRTNEYRGESCDEACDEASGR